MDKISFWQLLKDNKVVIPIIQRDYAQGRIGKEHIREKFLTQIKAALEDRKNSGELDFVYGTTKNDVFYTKRLKKSVRSRPQMVCIAY